MAKPSGRPIREELLATATALVQRVGVNGFSYGALANELGISAPSIHHHFRTKDDLIGAVVARYRADFAERARVIGADHRLGPADRICAYAELFDFSVNRESMCLCGSVASDWLTVGETARKEVNGFFDDQRRLLETWLADGVAAGAFARRVDVDRTSRLLLATLEGALLLARAGDTSAIPSAMAGQLLDVVAA